MSWFAKGLPRLTGAGLVLYRILWSAALLAALAAAVAGQIIAFAPTRAIECATLLAGSVILFRRRGADPVASMLALAFLLWVIVAASAWAGMSGAAVPLALLDRLRFLIFVSAMMLFPSGRFDPRWTRFGLVATALASLIGMAEALRLIPTALYVPLSMSCGVAAVAAMRARLRSLPPGVQRQQIKWVALGLAAGLVLVAISRLGALALAAGADLPPVAAPLIGPAFDLGITAIALGVLLSLLRFRLYDADAAISRSTALAALTLALIGVFAGSEAVLQSASQNLFGDMTGTISSGVAAALAAALIAPIHGRVTAWAERRFQRDLAELRSELPELLADLRVTGELDRLGDALLARLERGLHTSRSALLVGGEAVATRHVEADEIAEESPFSLSVPLDSAGAGTIGRLLLGPRPDGSRHGKDEREAVEEFSGQIARAVRAVQRDMARDADIRDLTRRLCALETRRDADAHRVVAALPTP